MNIHNCNICPRQCGVDRANTLGFCKIDHRPHIAEICLHRGEEPVLGGGRGVCNVFFSSCNLRCIFCQNYEISQETFKKQEITTIESAVTRIASILCTENIDTVGFVSPSHQAFQMKCIIDTLRRRGFNPTIIYTTNAYDSVETIRELEDYVDIYLPDFKYASDDLAVKYSSAPNYTKIATAAIAEMVRQKGTDLTLDESGTARKGIILRHLVLPGNVFNSINVLKKVAYDISPDLHISLMSQYYPEYKAKDDEKLSKYVTQKEYSKVTETAETLGLTNGWVQELGSSGFYCPDFSVSGNPFEKK